MFICGIECKALALLKSTEKHSDVGLTGLETDPVTAGHSGQTAARSEASVGGEIDAASKTVNEPEVTAQEEAITEEATTKGDALVVSSIWKDRNHGDCNIFNDLIKL